MLSGEASDELLTACAHPHRNAQHERLLVTLKHINPPVLNLRHKSWGLSCVVTDALAYINT
jgi:hypothetical protein